MSRLSSILVKLGLGEKAQRSWALYDIGNSAFATTIMVAVLPTFFADVIAKPLEPHLRSALWAYITAGALVISALLSPVIGTFADLCAKKKVLLWWFTLLGAVSSSLLFFMGEGYYVETLVLFTLGSVGFMLSNVLYEALLPSVSNDENIHLISASAYALGYLGGGVLLAINLVWIMKPELMGLRDSGMGVRLSFVSVGIWWILFSLPLFRDVAESPVRAANGLSFFGSLRKSISELKGTFQELRKYKETVLFLLAFWAYSDGIGTIMKLATIYGKEVGIGTSDLIGAILLVQFLGVPCSLAFGPIANKCGAKPTLIFTLCIYTICSICSYWMASALHFYLLAVAIAFVQGAAQAISRSIYAQMIPESKAGEFFGFYSVSSKLAGVIGPLMFAAFSTMAGGSQLAIALVASLFILGIILLWFVDIEKGKEVVRGL